MKRLVIVVALSLCWVRSSYSQVVSTGDNPGAMKVVCVAGCGGGSGGTSSTDNFTFTLGSSTFTPAGGTYNTTMVALSSGVAAAFRLTQHRALWINLRRDDGTEIGTVTNPLYVTGGGGGAEYQTGGAPPSPTTGGVTLTVADSTGGAYATADGTFNQLISDTTGRLWTRSLEVDNIDTNIGLLKTDITTLKNDTATIKGYWKAEDVAAVSGDIGIIGLAVRRDTPANQSNTNGDYETLQMTGGRLWVDASGKTLTVDGSGGTFPVTGNVTVNSVGSAVAINDIVPGSTGNRLGKAQDGAFSSGDVGVMALGVRNDSLGTTFSGVNGDYQPLSVTSTGVLRVDPSGTTTQPVSGTVTANAGTGTFTVGQATGSNLHIVCDSGCGSPPASSDNSAYTFGTTNTSPVAFVVDDVSTNAVAENSFGSARMTANRVQYVDISQTGANSTAIKVDGSAVTQPVSGTVTTTPPSNASTNLTQVAGTAVTVNSGNVTAGTLRVVLASDQPSLTNKILVTPDSVALPANQSVNVNQLAGNTTDTNSGNKAAGTLRVVIATDQPALTNKLLVTPDALPANQSVNVNQLAGTATDTNSGSKSAGTLRVVLATDQPALTNKLLVTPDANSSVNLAQLVGTATDVNSGNKSAGTLRVVLATDQPALTNKLLVTPDANSAVNVAQMNGVTVTMGAGATGTGVQRTNPVSASATGAAPPASAELTGGIGSGATGGFLVAPTVCDTNKVISMTSATTTLMITGVSGRQVHICSFHVLTAIANNVALIEGTGATCGTGTAGMAGGTTAANGWNFAANGGIALGSGVGDVLSTSTTGDSVCIITSAAGPLSGFIKYAIY